MSDDIVIRRIRADEVDAYRAIRVASLRDAPTAFGDTVAAAEARGRDVYVERVATSATGGERLTLFAEDQAGELVGLIGGMHDGEGSVDLVSMWVAPIARRRGIGERLVAGVVDWARECGASRVVLGVTAGNAAAESLYERCGFAFTGGTHPLREGDSCVCRIMEMRVSAPS